MTIKYFFQLIFVVWLIHPLQAEPPTLALPGCRDTCGDITIPYPFGIGTPNCFLNEWFEVVCHDNRPYLSKYYGQEFGGQVSDVYVNYLDFITINANHSRIRVCEDKSISITGNLSGSPFYLGYSTLTFVGCGNVMMLFANQTIMGGCTSTCNHPYRKVDGCVGNHCCQITIPSSDDFLDIYLNFSNLVIRNNSCAYAVFGNNPSFSDENLLEVSYDIDLQWKIPERMGLSLESNPNCGISGNDGYYDCQCSLCTEGNPFILNGCKGSVNNPNCRSRKRLIMLVVFGTSLGILFLGTTSLLSYKLISKRRDRKLKRSFFIRNGGLLLQQQLSVDENIVNKVRFFTSIELDKATDNFNENRVLGRGGQGTVYKGMLVDGKIIAVKKSKLDDKKQVEQFINEVVLLSQINHRNVVKLLGCCLETDVPLLVYEFIPNGTLYDLMHNQNDDFIMSWDVRLRIAREVAEALAYLHSATYVPIYHRDIKSSNILLDESHVAKVSDFGISRNVSVDHTHITTIVKGTFGYLDPEYFQSSQFTDKSDVYSYGVVLVELLTRQKPIPSTPAEGESHLGLAGQFLVYMEEDRLNMILDTQILDTASGEQVSEIAILARRCLSLDGRRRPTMREVVMQLESIKMPHKTLADQTDFEEERDIGVELVVITDGNASRWTDTNDTIKSSSDASPLMSDTS